MRSIISRQLLTTFVPAILFLLVVAMVSVSFQVSMPSITRDVTAIANIHPLSGILSTSGIMLWCVAASICFFSAMMLRDIKQPKTFWFLLNSALLSAYLMLDDAFLFHEELASMYLGISEEVVYAILGTTVLAYLTTFRQTILLKTRYSVLLMALGFLSLSVVIDAILEPWLWRLGHWKYFVEDGAKWLGITGWCSYYVHTSYLFVVKAYALPNDAVSPPQSVPP